MTRLGFRKKPEVSAETALVLLSRSVGQWVWVRSDAGRAHREAWAGLHSIMFWVRYSIKWVPGAGQRGASPSWQCGESAKGARVGT